MRFARLLAVPLAASIVAPATAAPSETKVELIRELLALSGGPAAAAQIGDLMLSQIHAIYPGLVEEVLTTETELDEEQRQALRERLADFDRFSQVFRERFDQRLDLEQVLESAYVPLYDRAFEETELAEIVAFYRTPTGRKVVEVLPVIYQQGMERTVPLVQPAVMNLLAEILAEQRAELFP